MKLDEQVITRAIIEHFTQKWIDHLDLEVAIVGGGPSELVAAYYLTKNARKVALFERKLSIGGGLWGGGMMFNQIHAPLSHSILYGRFCGGHHDFSLQGVPGGGKSLQPHV